MVAIALDLPAEWIGLRTAHRAPRLSRRRRRSRISSYVGLRDIIPEHVLLQQQPATLR